MLFLYFIFSDKSLASYIFGGIIISIFNEILISLKNCFLELRIIKEWINKQ